jgi:hypothetical protein
MAVEIIKKLTRFTGDQWLRSDISASAGSRHTWNDADMLHRCIGNRLITVPLKVKVNLSQYLIKLHATKPCGEVEVQLHTFLTPALDGAESSGLHLDRFIHGERFSAPTEEDAGRDS